MWLYVIRLYDERGMAIDRVRRIVKDEEYQHPEMRSIHEQLASIEEKRLCKQHGNAVKHRWAGWEKFYAQR